MYLSSDSISYTIDEKDIFLIHFIRGFTVMNDFMIRDKNSKNPITYIHLMTNWEESSGWRLFKRAFFFQIALIFPLLWWHFAGNYQRMAAGNRAISLPSLSSSVDTTTAISTSTENISHTKIVTFHIPWPCTSRRLVSKECTCWQQKGFLQKSGYPLHKACWIWLRRMRFCLVNVLHEASRFMADRQGCPEKGTRSWGLRRDVSGYNKPCRWMWSSTFFFKVHMTAGIQPTLAMLATINIQFQVKVLWLDWFFFFFYRFNKGYRSHIRHQIHFTAEGYGQSPEWPIFQ